MSEGISREERASATSAFWYFPLIEFIKVFRRCEKALFMREKNFSSSATETDGVFKISNLITAEFTEGSGIKLSGGTSKR